MNYHLSFNRFLEKRQKSIYEAVSQEEITCIRQKRRRLQDQLFKEKDLSKRKRLQMEIKVCDLKIMIAQIQ